MADRVAAPWISIGGHRHEFGAVVGVPAESRSWLLSQGLIEPTAEDAPPPDATAAALAPLAEHGFDVMDVEGTGSGGRVTLPDVEALIRSLESDGDEDEEDEEDEDEAIVADGKTERGSF